MLSEEKGDISIAINYIFVKSAPPEARSFERKQCTGAAFKHIDARIASHYWPRNAENQTRRRRVGNSLLECCTPSRSWARLRVVNLSLTSIYLFGDSAVTATRSPERGRQPRHLI